MKLPDIDIDMANRTEVINLTSCIPASIIKEEITPHNTGVYYNRVPIDLLTGLSSIDYKEAEKNNILKIDFLNNTVYKQVKSRDHLVQLFQKEPEWQLLEVKEVVEQLYHLNRYYDLIQKKKPYSVHKIAMLLALIRPGKKHLIDKPWSTIEKHIWTKTDKYSFKKSHAYAFAHLICVQLNLIEEKALEELENEGMV